MFLRMRKRANLAARMERCAALLEENPEALYGRWRVCYPGYEKLYLEIGCGKGRFTAESAALMPEVLYIALERVPDAMILAMERVKKAGLENVRFIDSDAKLADTLFAPCEVNRLYINFCDPWPKSRDAKLRLTSPGFLRLYGDLLPVGGEIHFKTDNTPLFDWSAEQMRQEGWTISELTHDLHENGPVGVMTDYEAKFYEQGLKINRLVAIKSEVTKNTAAGPVPRLRNASLTDARGYEESREAHREEARK